MGGVADWASAVRRDRTPPEMRTREASERFAAVAAASRAGLGAGEAWREWGADVRGLDGDGGLVWVDSPAAPQGARTAADAAQRLAYGSGVPLAEVLEALARIETVAEESRLAQHVALAGPTASARVLTWLPVAGLVLAVVVEPSTLDLLATTGFGWALLALGAGLWWAGRAWSGRMAREAAVESPRDLIVWSALLSACTRSGLDVLGSLAAVAAAARQPLGEVVERLRSGHPWDEAWDGCPAALRPLSASLRPAWERGTSPVAALDALASAQLAGHKAKALAAAATLGVRLTLPLSLCLLPAFIAVGVVPLVVAVGAGVVSDVAPALTSLQPSGPSESGSPQGGTP